MTNTAWYTFGKDTGAGDDQQDTGAGKDTGAGDEQEVPDRPSRTRALAATGQPRALVTSR